jgi:hypothetical protein
MYYIPTTGSIEYRTFVEDLILKAKAYIRLIKVKKSARLIAG